MKPGWILAVGAALLAAGLLLNLGGAPRSGANTRPPVPSPLTPVSSLPTPIFHLRPLVSHPAITNPKSHADAAELARIRGSYQNYRTAVATDDGELEASLRPQVLKDRATCLALAQADLDRAASEIDSEVARKVIAVLGKTP